jgi:hypothetical protein
MRPRINEIVTKPSPVIEFPAPKSGANRVFEAPCTLRLMSHVVVVGPLGQGKASLGAIDLVPSQVLGLDSTGILLDIGGDALLIGWANVASVISRKV